MDCCWTAVGNYSAGSAARLGLIEWIASTVLRARDQPQPPVYAIGSVEWHRQQQQGGVMTVISRVRPHECAQPRTCVGSQYIAVCIAKYRSGKGKTNSAAG